MKRLAPTKPGRLICFTSLGRAHLGDGLPGSGLEEWGAVSPAFIGEGTYRITGTAIAVKAGGPSANGTIKPNEYIDVGGKRYKFFRKL
jgi:hypothetical protein